MVKTSIITTFVKKLIVNVSVHRLLVFVPTPADIVMHVYQQLILKFKYNIP